VETEFGCLVADESLGDSETMVDAIKNHVFCSQRLGAIDLHARDEVFEPSRSGGFLLNGGRLYVDAVGSHLEYATAECTRLKDLVANDRAGQRIIVQAIRDLGLSEEVKVYNNSVDHFGGHTFGCHENYLSLIDDEFFSSGVNRLLPFLITRQIFAGVGRVGGHILTTDGARPSHEDVMSHPVDYIWVSQVYRAIPDPNVRFQISQRADHILKPVASRVRFNRAIINPKWEHFYSHERLQRLHMLFGESNQNEFAYALKMGTTSLVLRLIEEELVPQEWVLAQPMIALRRISRDEAYAWPVEWATGAPTDAISIQRGYLELAERYRGDGEDTDWVLDEWAKTLDGLAEDPMQLADRLDWVAKKQMVESYMAEMDLAWDDDSLHSVDLEYHNIDPEESLFHALQDMGQTTRIVDELDIIDSQTVPPQNTRAKGRSILVEKILKRKGNTPYAIDWNGVAFQRHLFIPLDDPYRTYEAEANTVP